MRDIESHISELRSMLSLLSGAASDVRRKLDIAKETKRQMNGDVRRVTDHSLVRYLERVKGIDMEAVRGEINALVDASVGFKNAKDARWNSEAKLTLIVEGETVVTILGAEQSEKYLGRSLENGARALEPSS
jgi:hypothetical protein